MFIHVQGNNFQCSKYGKADGLLKKNTCPYTRQRIISGVLHLCS